MKAIVYTEYGPPEVLSIQEVGEPTPDVKEVRIRVHAAAVTTADSAARKGAPFIARLAFGLFHPKLSVLGTELSGEIESVGTDVTRFKKGDRVFAATGASLGAHAEFVCLRDDAAVALKPDNLTYAEAAALCEGGLTALPFLRDIGKIREGQRVLINGAGGCVGSAAVQIAKHFGADVTGVCSGGKTDLVQSLGADHIIDYTKEDFTSADPTYDIIFDAAGKSSFSRSKGTLMDGGVYLTTVPSMAVFAQMVWTSKLGGKKARIAFTGLRPPGERATDLGVLRELAMGTTIRPVVDSCYPFEKIADAHRRVDTGHKAGSVVLVFG